MKSWMVVLLLFVPGLAAAQSVEGRIVGVVGGDILILVDKESRSHKIRLAGIDSPEKGQNFGDQAKANLSRLTQEKEARADCRRRDRYQREVCVVFVEGRDVGLEQIKAGLAWWYQRYLFEQKRQERLDYEQAEHVAHAGKLGLWREARPVSPWDWRKKGGLDE